MKLLLLAALTLLNNAAAIDTAATSSPTSNDQQFKQFKHHYNKVYNTKQDEDRAYQTFVAHLQTLDTTDPNNWRGVTQFSDLTEKEFRQKYAMHVPLVKDNNRPAATTTTAAFTQHILPTLPKEIDWTKRNAVSPVKNQGQCGSCWVFSATGSMEGALAIATGLPVVSLSEEEYLACYSPNRQICNGGDAEAAFRWAQSHSICTESAYPYVAPTGKPYPPPPTHVCKASMCNSTANVGLKQGQLLNWTYVAKNDIGAMMVAVSQGPVSITVNAGPMANYRGGVMSGQCNPYGYGDHAVLVVGYGHDIATGLDYWKIKNSYGTQFGENGYIRVKRNDSLCNGAGELGMLQAGLYPTVVANR
jgi:C1A family cysteine protease